MNAFRSPGAPRAFDRLVGRADERLAVAACGRPWRSASRSRSPASPPACASTNCQKPCTSCRSWRMHEVAAVAAEVGAVGRVLGARQHRAPGRVAGRAAAGRCSRRIRSDSRAGTRRGSSGSSSRLRSSSLRRRACAPSRARGCEMPSTKPNGSMPSQVGRRRGTPSSRSRRRTAPRSRCCEAVEPAGQRVEHHQHVRHARPGAPLPAARVVGADVAEAARAVGVVGHAGDELVGERVDDRRRRRPGRACPSLVSATCSAVVGRRLDRLRACVTGAAASQRARRIAVRDAQQQERRLGVVLVAEAHQPLDVVELDRQRGARASTLRARSASGAHSSLSQASACASLIVARSRPSRMRWLRFEIDQREARVGLVPDLRRHLVAALVVLERLLDARAAVDQPVGARPADAVAEQQVEAPRRPC